MHGAGLSVIAMKRSAFFILSSLLFVRSLAHADDPKARAKQAYARGVAAHDAKDYKTAARAFTEADTILPSSAALAAALDDAVLADDPVLGAELIERGNRPGATPELTKSLAEARTKLAGRAGRIRIVCPAGSTCSALVDERSTNRELWVAPGPHTVTLRVDTTMKEQTIDVHGGETIVLEPEKPPAVVQPPPPPVTEPLAPTEKEHHEPSKHKGLPPLVTYLGAGFTLAMVGGTITTGLLTKNRHDDFVAKGCDKGPAAGCQTLHDEGIPLLVMTNVFLGLSILSAVATTGIAVFFTDWNASVSTSQNRAILGIGRSF